MLLSEFLICSDLIASYVKKKFLLYPLIVYKNANKFNSLFFFPLYIKK